MVDQFDKLVSELTTFSLTLFGASVATSAFIYSIVAQLFKSGTSISDWLLLVHVVITAGLVFFVSFGLGLASRYAKAKSLLQTGCLLTFIIGLIIMLSVMAMLLLASFPS